MTHKTVLLRDADGKIIVNPEEETTTGEHSIPATASLSEMLPKPPRATPKAPQPKQALQEEKPKTSWRTAAAAAFLSVLLLISIIAAVINNPAASDAAPPPQHDSTTAATNNAYAAPAAADDAAPQVTAAPTPTPAAALERSVVAYAAPHGATLGAIDAGQHYTAAARYGDSWTQISTEASGLVWVQQGDVQVQDHAALPDLKPLPTPTFIPQPVIIPTALPHVQAAAVKPTVCVSSSRAQGCGENRAEAQANLEHLEREAREQRRASIQATATATTALEVFERENNLPGMRETR